ncbi:hypothetical protein COY95_04285 [Candidatus Woesearchaeota archaeon CG_4_10_14_0_8_um_filter_47_5]|nr:MAG: hypothetical protein COY95_04285 [Candidatus Woesearchaeota archaeon CG_4_10_14_0_8_um_filter_47_5]
MTAPSQTTSSKKTSPENPVFSTPSAASNSSSASSTSSISSAASVSFTYIDSKEPLEHAASAWEQEPVLGIDTESENNLHHYGAYISIIQVAGRRRQWIVDVLALPEVKPLLAIFENRAIQKIFHNADSDLRVIYNQFGCRVQNIFDTQTAALLLGIEDIGLGALLEQFFNVQKKQKFQTADWTRRPLPPELLSYAVKDTLYLIRLRDLFLEKLMKLNRLSWAQEEFAATEHQTFNHQEPSYTDIKGIGYLTDRERAIAKCLFLLREEFARKVDRPVYYVMNTKILKDLAMHPPKTRKAWETMRGVHPIVRKEAQRFFSEVAKGKEERLPHPVTKTRRYTGEQKKQFQKLERVRSAVAGKAGIQSYLILSKEQMRDIVLQGDSPTLRDWQRRLVGEHIPSLKRKTIPS